jgi:hypothetical protein
MRMKANNWVWRYVILIRSILQECNKLKHVYTWLLGLLLPWSAETNSCHSASKGYEPKAGAHLVCKLSVHTAGFRKSMHDGVRKGFFFVRRILIGDEPPQFNTPRVPRNRKHFPYSLTLNYKGKGNDSQCQHLVG